jgi:hypothetical protein
MSYLLVLCTLVGALSTFATFVLFVHGYYFTKFCTAFCPALVPSPLVLKVVHFVFRSCGPAFLFCFCGAGCLTILFEYCFCYVEYFYSAWLL